MQFVEGVAHSFGCEPPLVCQSNGKPLGTTADNMYEGTCVQPSEANNKDPTDGRDAPTIHDSDGVIEAPENQQAGGPPVIVITLIALVLMATGFAVTCMCRKQSEKEREHFLSDSQERINPNINSSVNAGSVSIDVDGLDASAEQA